MRLLARTLLAFACALMALVVATEARAQETSADAADSPSAASTGRAQSQPDESAATSDAASSAAAADDLARQRPTRAPRRRVGMCGSQAQSIDAPPPLLPAVVAVAFGCKKEIHLSLTDAKGQPDERVELPPPQPESAAVLVTLDFSISARLAPELNVLSQELSAEEHRSRHLRPPRS